MNVVARLAHLLVEEVARWSGGAVGGMGQLAWARLAGAR